MAASGFAAAAAATATTTAAATTTTTTITNAAAAASATLVPVDHCGCTNIAIMQLFHELKQRFPAVPDRVVSECVSQNFHDKETCEAILTRENQGYLLHSYPTCLKMSTPGSCDSENPVGRSPCPNVCGRCPQSDDTPRRGHCPSGPHVCSSDQDNGIGTSAEPICASSAQSLSSAINTNFVNQESRDISQNEKSNVINTNMYECSRVQSCHANNVKEERLHQHDESVPTNSEFSCQTSRSHYFHSGTSTSRTEAHGSTNVSGSETVTSHKDITSASRGITTRSSVTESVSSSSGFTRTCVRPTSLNVGQIYQTHSAPVTATSFKPFQDQPNSACAKQCGGSSVPYTGSFQHSQRSETVGNSGCSGDGGGSGIGCGISGSNINFNAAGRSGPPNYSRGNIPTSVYSDRTVVNSYHVNVNCSMHGRGSSSVNVSGSSSRTLMKPSDMPVHHQEPQARSRSVVTLEPAPHFSQHNIWGPSSSSLVSQHAPATQPRSYTSVNLTLRPPSADPQPPIDIQSGGTSLMYSTSSYDPRQGYQSKLQICIGPGGVGSVSAMRTRAHDHGHWAPQPAKVQQSFIPQHPPAEHTTAQNYRNPPPPPPPPMPLSPVLSTLSEDTLESTTSSESCDLQKELQSIKMDHLQPTTREVRETRVTAESVAVAALLERQLERKMRLQTELRREREKLRTMQRDVRDMKKDLAQRQLHKRTAAATLPQLSTLQKMERLRQEIHLLTEECKRMTVEVDKRSDSQVPLGETDEEFYKNIYTGQQGNVTLNATQDAYQNRPEPPLHGPYPTWTPDPDPREGQSWTCSECTFRNYWELEYCEQCDMPRPMLAGETQDIHIHVTHHNFPIRSYLTVGS